MSDAHYLINLTGGEIVQCPGDQATAERHLRYLRERHIAEAEEAGRDPYPLPSLIGVYPPWSVGGPDGKGGVFSYGYKPTLLGSIDAPRSQWSRVEEWS
ncbi:hypothetical protein [Mycobacterium sp. DL99]|uniref:hypothetical protein n=1 Tax=Mycobacterium sp. DL99 TaxID=2528957 RepID=UPI00107FF774|nr:hypothetical protein [Mycobacterium sp. DL99]